MDWDDYDGVPKHLRCLYYDPYSDEDFIDTINVQARNTKTQEAQPSIDYWALVPAAGMRSLTRDDLSKPLPDFLLTPGTEATVALRILNRAPHAKHIIWNAVQKLLVNIAPEPIRIRDVIEYLTNGIDLERQCWGYLEHLESAQTLSSITDLPLKRIMIAMSSLVGDTRYIEDPIAAVETVDYDLSDDMALLLRHHLRLNSMRFQLQTNSIGSHQMHLKIEKQMDRFKAIRTRIVQRLSPGRIAEQMQKLLDKIKYLVDTHEWYSEVRTPEEEQQRDE